MAVLSILLSSFAHFCCSSNRARKSTTVKHRYGLKAKLRISRHHLSSKALLKMISWRKVNEREKQFGGDCSDHDSSYDDEAIWRRTIMMGEKCRPLDYSGKIVYDSHGNLLS